jgi:hypothetical protein
MKYLVFDKTDLEKQGLKSLLGSHANVVEAPDPETAALMFVEEWGDQHSYDTQESDYYVHVFPHKAAEVWFKALPDKQTEEHILQVAIGYRGYKTWAVEEGVDEMDPDLMEEESDE